MALDYSGTYATPRLDLAEALEAYTLDLQKQRFAAHRMAPIRGVAKKAGAFSAITSKSILQNPDTRRSPGAGYNRVSIGAQDKTYSCQNNGIEVPVEDSEKENYRDDFDHELTSAKIGQRIVLSNYEQRVKTLLWDPTTSWPSGTATLYTDNSSAPWDAAASDVIGHIAAAKANVLNNCGMPANALLLGEQVLNNILQNTAIIARFPGAAVVTRAMIESQLAAIFGLEKLIVGGGSYDSADKGQSVTVANIWGDDYAMVAVVADEGAPLSEPSVGRTILWEPMGADTVNVESYREEQTESLVIRCKHWTDEIVVDANYGHLMKVDA